MKERNKEIKKKFKLQAGINGPILRARWAVAPSEGALTCYLHVML